MNTFAALVLALLAVAICAAEPAHQRGLFYLQRQVLETTTEVDSTTTDNGAPYAPAGYRPEQEFSLPGETDSTEPEDGPEETTGPYPASGWQPSGRLLNLPSFQRQSVQQPRAVYGQPDATTTEEYDSTTTTASSEFESNETTDEPDSELLPNSAQLKNRQTPNNKLQSLQRSQKLTQGPAAQIDQGTYYVKLADGSVQPVAYYQFPTNAAGGQVSARIQIQPQQSALVAQTPAFVQSPFRSAALVQAPLTAAYIQAPQSSAFLQASPSAAFVQAPRSAAFVQGPFVQQPQYYVNPYAFPSASAVSYSSQYQSSW